MARAKRHYLPGHVWHLTHRCHKKEFLLKFSRDRRRWTEWTQSIAVGNKQFIEKIKEQLGVRARSQKAKESKDGYQLRESQTSYGGNGNRIDKNNTINNVDIDNTSLWNICS